MDHVHVIVAIDEDGCEAMYVGGDLHETEGTTVYATDIADAMKSRPFQFSHVAVQGFHDNKWPEVFDSLIQKLSY